MSSDDQPFAVFIFTKFLRQKGDFQFIYEFSNSQYTGPIIHLHRHPSNAGGCREMSGIFGQNLMTAFFSLYLPGHLLND